VSRTGRGWRREIKSRSPGVGGARAADRKPRTRTDVFLGGWRLARNLFSRSGICRCTWRLRDVEEADVEDSEDEDKEEEEEEDTFNGSGYITG
jgi:hypothetical protein